MLHSQLLDLILDILKSLLQVDKVGECRLVVDHDQPFNVCQLGYLLEEGSYLLTLSQFHLVLIAFFGDLRKEEGPLFVNRSAENVNVDCSMIMRLIITALHTVQSLLAVSALLLLSVAVELGEVSSPARAQVKILPLVLHVQGCCLHLFYFKYNS